jgi:hypothetical protein
MFNHEIETLLKKTNIVISDFMCTLQEDFGDVFTIAYNQVYEELRMKGMDKEKIDREVKEQEELDEELELKESEKEEKIKNGEVEKIEEEQEEFNSICFFLFFILIFF